MHIEKMHARQHGVAGQSRELSKPAWASNDGVPLSTIVAGLSAPLAETEFHDNTTESKAWFTHHCCNRTCGAFCVEAPDMCPPAAPPACPWQDKQCEGPRLSI